MLMLQSSRPVLTMLNYWKEGMEVLRPQALNAFFVDLRCAVNKIQTALDKLGPELTLLDGKQPSLWSWTAFLESNGLEWRKATIVRSVEGRSVDLPQDESAKVQVLTTTQDDSAAESEGVANDDESKSELVLQWRRSSFLRSLGQLAEYRKDSQIQRKMLKA